MSENHGPHRTPIRPLRRFAVRTALVATAIGALLVTGACEDKGLGRACNLGQAVPVDQGAYSVNDSDCQTRICVKPAVQAGVQDLDTGPYCSDTCVADSDCQGGQIRDRSNPNDRRCKGGYTCAMPFGVADDAAGGGQLCCQKICLCRDFFLASVGPAIPESCQGGAASCSAPGQRD